jgi:hypothetical protein
MKVPRLILFIFFVPAFLIPIQLKAQNTSVDKTVQYETIYDDPYNINKLFLLIQPVYGEVFSTNTNIGFGLEAQYYLKDIIDFQVGYRMPYAASTDLMRHAAEKNSDALNSPKWFYYVEGGLNYHVIDRKESSRSKFILYSKNFKKYNRWETMVPESILVPSNLRRIYGIRAGGTAYQSSFDVNRILSNQNKAFSDTSSIILEQASIYGNIASQGFYIGGTMELIRNIAVNFENLYDQTASDLMFSVFLDLLINPFISIEDIQYKSESSDQIETVSADIIDTNMLGFRGGIKGKFNRAIGFSYSVEIGMRPGIRGSGFYLMGVFSVPVFGFRLDKKAALLGNP